MKTVSQLLTVLQAKLFHSFASGGSWSAHPPKGTMHPLVKAFRYVMHRVYAQDGNNHSWMKSLDATEAAVRTCESDREG